MNRNQKLLITGASILAVGAGGIGIAQAVGGDSEEQVTGPRADRAKRAAVDAVGGGRVVGVEREDEGGAGWEVEVVRKDGQQLEVHLNRDFQRVGLESDNDGGGGEEQSQELPQGSERVKLDPSVFSTRIDNPYWPMRPGSRWVYRETDSEGANQRVVVTVTRKTKKVANGIEARVVRDVVTEDGEPVEVTDDWYAQDSAGNIWYLGERTTEYENGKPKTTAGSFEAGVDRAQPGIIMPAEPEPGLTYRQEYYRGEAEDKGRIVSLHEQAEVPFGHFENVLMTKDLNPLEPKVLEFKFYARKVGPVLAVSVSGGSDREELVSYSPGR